MPDTRTEASTTHRHLPLAAALFGVGLLLGLVLPDRRPDGRQ